MAKFKMNNDLKEASFTGHNRSHYWINWSGTFVSVFFAPFYLVWLLMLLWEVWDGFKPWYTEFAYNDSQSKFVNWLRENCLYSNGFSVQDVVLWNSIGAIVGLIGAVAVSIMNGIAGAIIASALALSVAKLLEKKF